MYLTVEQRRRIDRITAAEGVPMAEVIRRALDEYLSEEMDSAAVLAKTFGAATEAEVPSRDEWNRG